VTRTLFAALLGGHVAWTAHLLASYFVASLPCPPGGTWSTVALQAATFSALAVTAAAVAAGRAAARERAAPEQRFLGRFGMALGAVFLFAIVLAAVPAALLSPCT
jgi:hypothetical protein